MAARRRDTLVLEIDVGGGAESLLKLISPHKRGAAIGGILLPDLLGDRNPHVGLVEFLVSALLAEDRVEVFRLERLPGAGMKERQGLVGHDGLDVEKMRGNL